MAINGLKWERKESNWVLSIGTAVGFMIASSLLFDDLFLALAFGLALGIVMIPFSGKHSVAISDGTVTFDNGDGEDSVPVSELAALRQEPKGDVLVLEFADGKKIAIDTCGDDAGVAEFIERVHDTPELSHIS